MKNAQGRAGTKPGRQAPTRKYDAESLAGRFETLYINKKDKDAPIPLSRINAMLQKEHQKRSCSKMMIKAEVQEEGICLRTGEAYGSATRLQAALKQDPDLIIPKDDAKEYKYVRMCLIRLHGNP